MKFYDGKIEIVYDEKKHKYARMVDGKKVVIPSVTTILKVMNKPALVPWAAKMVAEKMLRIMPRMGHPDYGWVVPETEWSKFEQLVFDAKSAPRDIVIDAADVGKEAHNIIEGFINSSFNSISASDMGFVNAADGWHAKIKDERITNCVSAALNWMKKHKVRWIKTECVVYSLLRDYAGIMDGLAEVSSCDDKNCCFLPFDDVLSVVDWKSSNRLYPEYLLQTAAYQSAYEEMTNAGIADRWILRLGKEDGEFEPWHTTPEDFQPDLAAFEDCLKLSRSFKVVENRVSDIEKKFKKTSKDWLDE